MKISFSKLLALMLIYFGNILNLEIYWPKKNYTDIMKFSHINNKIKIYMIIQLIVPY